MKLENLTLTQDAYLQTICTYSGLLTFYQAVAEDKDGEEYMVTWKIINPDCEDESDACNWGNPASIKKL